MLLWSQLNAKISLSFKRDFGNDHSKLRILVDSRLKNQRIIVTFAPLLPTSRKLLDCPMTRWFYPDPHQIPPTLLLGQRNLAGWQLMRSDGEGEEIKEIKGFRNISWARVNGIEVWLV